MLNMLTAQAEEGAKARNIDLANARGHVQAFVSMLVFGLFFLQTDILAYVHVVE